MELIKQIKQAEAQAEQIIAQAKAEAVRQSQQAAERRMKALSEAEQKRKKTIADAVNTAHSQGIADVEAMKAQGSQTRQQLRDNIAGKIPGAVAKIVNYLKG